MPSRSFTDTELSRRQLLAGVASSASVGLAGCAGRVPGFGPDTVETVETGDAGELVWQYPHVEDDGEPIDGIGYVAVQVGDPADDGTTRIRLNSTVGGIAASDRYQEYEADWARFWLGPPADYPVEAATMRVEPPPWPAVRASFDRQGGRRELVVELPEIDGDGTITVPVFLRADPDRQPERIHCSVVVQSSQPAPLGRTVRAAASGTIPLAEPETA